MATPAQRFTFYHDTLYPNGVVVNIPLGWKAAKLRLERDKDYHSLIEYFDSEFIWYGKAMQVIQEVEEIGINESLRVKIELKFNYTWETIFQGQLDISQVEEIAKADSFYKIKCPIIRDDFWANFNNKKTNVYGLGTSGKITLPLPSQKIRQRYYSTEVEGFGFLIQENYFGQYTPTKNIVSEVENFYELPISQSLTKPVWMFDAKYDGLYTIDLNIECSRYVISGYESPRNSLDFFIQINDDSEIEATYTPHNYIDASVYAEWPGTPGDDVGTCQCVIYQVINLKKGDRVRIYLKQDGSTTGHTIVFWGSNGFGGSILGSSGYVSPKPSGMVSEPSYFKVTADTIFEDTTTDAFLIKDAASKLIEQITGVSGSLQSTYFETNARLRAIMRGKHFRGWSFAEKELFMNFQNDWWMNANTLLNLGLGYVQGEDKIEIEDKAYFYDPVPVVFFDNVPDLVRTNDLDRYVKSVQIGFNKWSAESASGMDDPQAKKNYRTMFANFGKEEKILCNFYMASLGQERTRRNRVELGKDDRLDEEIFCIDVKELEDGYTPEVGADFDSVTDLLNPDERYNVRDTPATMFRRWQNVFNGCMQEYPSEEFEFSGAEGNYETEKEFANDDWEFPGSVHSESENVSVTNNFLWIPKIYKCSVPLKYETYKAILANRKKAVGVSRSSTNHVAMHIIDLQYTIMRGSAEFYLLLAENRKP